MEGRSTKRGRECGQTLVEFAVVANILVVLLLAVVQFGLVWNNYVQVTDAAREGARRAVVNRSGGQSGMVNAGVAAARAATPGLQQADLVVQVSSQTGTWNQGDPIKVTTSYPYSISILGIAVKSGHLVSATTMRAE